MRCLWWCLYLGASLGEVYDGCRKMHRGSHHRRTSVYCFTYRYRVGLLVFTMGSLVRQRPCVRENQIIFALKLTPFFWPVDHGCRGRWLSPINHHPSWHKRGISLLVSVWSHRRLRILTWCMCWRKARKLWHAPRIKVSGPPFLILPTHLLFHSSCDISMDA